MSNRHQFLLCRLSSRLCALPLAHVSEVMRPLPVASVAGMPTCVMGVALIRGNSIPVVDMAALVFGDSSAPSRFITVKLDTRYVALAVGDVIGVRTMSAQSLDGLPPLLAGTTDAITTIGTLDSELLVVLRASHILSDVTWDALEAGGAPT